MNKSIFRQLFVSYGAMILVVFIALFGGLYVGLSHYLDRVIIKEINFSLALERNALESELKQRMLNLKSWARLSVMDDLITHDADMRITQTLEILKAQYHLSGHIYVVSKSMQLIAADQFVSRKPNFSSWLPAIQAQQTLIGRQLDPLTQQPVIVLWQAIYASFDGSRLLGYMAMTYPWKEVEQLYNAFDDNIAVLLFDSNGTLLLRSEDLIVQPDIALLKQAPTYKSVFKSTIEALFPSVMIDDRPVAEIALNKRAFFVLTSPNTTATPWTNTWQWFALADKNRFYAPIHAVFKIVLIVVVLLLLSILIMIFLISHKFSKKIKLLTKAAVKIAETQDLSKRVPVYGKNELTQLALAFNEMCHQLEEAWRVKEQATQDLQVLNISLEQKIADRTKHLAWQVNHDILTGLPNRALLFERLSQAILRAKRSDIILAVLFIDLDGFKAINDTFGHDKGDYLLVELAKRFIDAIREPDTVARLGGDEFVILMQMKREEDLVPPLERIKHLINEPIITEGQALKVSPSIGVTLYPRDLSDADNLLRHADHAMYEAKQKGPNQVCFFDVLQDMSMTHSS